MIANWAALVEGLSRGLSRGLARGLARGWRARWNAGGTARALGAPGLRRSRGGGCVIAGGRLGRGRSVNRRGRAGAVARMPGTSQMRRAVRGGALAGKAARHKRRRRLRPLAGGRARAMSGAPGASGRLRAATAAAQAETQSGMGHAAGALGLPQRRRLGESSRWRVAAPGRRPGSSGLQMRRAVRGGALAGKAARRKRRRRSGHWRAAGLGRCPERPEHRVGCGPRRRRRRQHSQAGWGMRGCAWPAAAAPAWRSGRWRVAAPGRRPGSSGLQMRRAVRGGALAGKAARRKRRRRSGHWRAAGLGRCPERPEHRGGCGPRRRRRKRQAGWGMRGCAWPAAAAPAWRFGRWRVAAPGRRPGSSGLQMRRAVRGGALAGKAARRRRRSGHWRVAGLGRCPKRSKHRGGCGPRRRRRRQRSQAGWGMRGCAWPAAAAPAWRFGEGGAPPGLEIDSGPGAAPAAGPCPGESARRANRRVNSQNRPPIARRADSGPECGRGTLRMHVRAALRGRIAAKTAKALYLKGLRLAARRQGRVWRGAKLWQK